MKKEMILYLAWEQQQGGLNLWAARGFMTHIKKEVATNPNRLLKCGDVWLFFPRILDFQEKLKC